MAKKAHYELSQAHWTLENYSERFTTAQWNQILLDEADKIIFKGSCRRLVGKKVGPGVYEIYKAPEES